jgi:PAS domain-containing protein
MADAASPLSPVQQELALLRQRVADLETAQAAWGLAEKVLETIRDPLLILQPDLRVQAANPAFYTLFQVSPVTTVRQRIYD